MKIVRNRNDIILLIIGDGPEKNKCEKMVQDSPWKNKIKLIGKIPQNQLPAFYNEAYLFLLPSKYEIFGMVILEAMYFSVPVITSSTAGADDIVDNDKNGIIISNLEPTIWIDTIINLLNDTEKRNAMATMASEDIHSKYLWRKAVKSYIKSYIKVMKYCIPIHIDKNPLHQ